MPRASRLLVPSSIVHLLSSTHPAVALRVERLAAVDDQRVAGDVARGLGGEIDHRALQVLVAADAAERESIDLALGGSDGSTLSGAALPGRVIGPSFAADEVPDVIPPAGAEAMSPHARVWVRETRQR